MQAHTPTATKQPRYGYQAKVIQKTSISYIEGLRTSDADSYIAVVFLGTPKSSKSSTFFDFGVISHVLVIPRPRDTYVDAKFIGESISDVCFKFLESPSDENLKILT